jgi:protein TonB
MERTRGGTVIVCSACSGDVWVVAIVDHHLLKWGFALVRCGCAGTLWGRLVSNAVYALQRWMRRIDDVRGAVMFQESLVESTSLLCGRNRWPALISFAVQATIATLLVALPLLHPEILPMSAPRLTLEAAPPMKPPVPVQPVRVETSSAAATVATPTQVVRISTEGFRERGPAVDQPLLPVGVNFVGAGSSPLSALGSFGSASPHVVVGPAGAGGPLHVSTGVMAGQLLEPIRPEYPAIARLSRTEGTVVVQAIIATSGKIESAHVVSGPAMLQAAALQAVCAARYRPFLLNGLPTEVETTVSVVFRMGS